MYSPQGIYSCDLITSCLVNTAERKLEKKPSVKFSNLNPLLVWDISVVLQKYFPLACGFAERNGISVLNNRVLKEDGLIINAYLYWFGFFACVLIFIGNVTCLLFNETVSFSVTWH